MAIGERIKQIRKEAGLSQSVFGNHLKISFQAVSALEKGTNVPSEQTITLICREFGIREKWLRDGKGDMREPEPAHDALDAVLDEYGLPREFRGLFLAYRNLRSEDERAAVRQFIHNAAEEIRVAESASGVPDETEEERLERETREEAEEYYRLRLEERKAIRDSEAKQAGTPRNSDSYGDTGGVA